jgi:hypothetical protein
LMSTKMKTKELQRAISEQKQIVLKKEYKLNRALLKLKQLEGKK